MENRQLNAYRQIVSAFRRSGQNFIARHSRDEAGRFNYSYTLVVGSTRYERLIPAQIASEVFDLENQLDYLSQELQKSRQRLNELPQLIAGKQKECDSLGERLKKARQALEERN